MTKFFNKAALLALSLSCFTLPEVYAGDLHLNVYEKGVGTDHGDWYTVKSKDGINYKFSEFNDTYLGGAGKLEFFQYTTGYGWWYKLMLPTTRKRHKVHTLNLKEKGSKRIEHGVVVRDEKVFESKEAAKEFCGALAQLGADVHNYKNKKIDASGALFLSFDQLGFDKSVVAVPYEIAYGNDSKLAADGENSTKSRRHYFCTNPFGWEPNPNKGEDENELVGIREASFNAGTYTVVCMNTEKPKTTFFESGSVLGESYWSNGPLSYPVTSNTPTLHQLNKQVGAEYCPMK